MSAFSPRPASGSVPDGMAAQVSPESASGLSSDLALDLAGVRAVHLAAQGLLRPPPRRADAAAVLAAIRQMGVLQIDTIHVVARSPYLVLWSRLGDYQPAWLDLALAEGKLFEYWAHEASFVPIEDFKWFRHRMLDPSAMGWKNGENWLREQPQLGQQILQQIREQGPTRASDFERTDGQKGGWWQWKPEKRTLEALFTIGEVMIARREKFHRIYDLRERLLPDWIDARDLPPQLETNRQLQLKAVKALGICRAEWVADYFRCKRAQADVRPLLASGQLLPVKVEGWDEPGLFHPDHLPLVQQAASGQLKPGLCTILSPFDPVVWDRRRALELFDFDYRIECYTPEAKRRYGYFTLPLLRNGKLIGRLDAKAHRREQIFEVKALHLEPGQRVSGALAQDLARCLSRFADWHACPKVHITRTEPAALGPLLQSQLDA